MTQKSLPVLSCPGVWRICVPVAGLERRPLRFLSSALGGFLLHWVDFCCMGFGRVLDSPLSLHSTWRRNGSGALVHPGKQAATARKWFISYFLDCSCCQTKGFSHPIYITTKCYSSYQQYYYYYPYYESRWRNWPRESIICLYHGRSLM